MSDSELRNYINRMQMERQYAQLTAKEVSPGKKFVKDPDYIYFDNNDIIEYLEENK